MASRRWMMSSDAATGAPSPLAHGEGEIAVIAVKEAVALVEAAHLPEQRAAQGQADAVHRRHLDPRRGHAGGVREAVNDGASDIAPVAAEPTRAVEARQSHVTSVAQRAHQALEPCGFQHLGVVVEEAEGLARGQGRPLVERAYQTDIAVVALIAKR